MAKRSTSIRDRARALLKRSKPACHICGRAISWDAHWLDPESFVVDHVIPLHKGGPDAISNMAAAHRACNSTKRARDYAPIIRRSQGVAWPE